MSKITTIMFSALLVGLVSACGKPPSKPFQSSGPVGGGSATPGPGAVAGPDGQPVDATAGVPLQASLAAFTTHVYNPILGKYCASCHYDTFAPRMQAAPEGEIPPPPAGIDKAHLAFLSRVSFNAFAGVEQTVPVVKMDYHAGGHNCWEAEAKACYDEMVTAINGWLDELKAAGFTPTPVTYPNSTDQVMLNTATNITPPVDATQYVAGFVSNATLTAPFAAGTDDVDGPLATYAMAPMGTAPGPNQPPNAQQLPNAPSVTFNMNVTTPGTYFVWARVKTPAANNSRFYLSANGGAALQFNPGATTDWKWVQVIQNNQPFQFNVAAAATVPVRLIYRDPGAKVNALVITRLADEFNGEQFSNQFMELRVPLKVPGVANASLLATIWKKTDAENRRSLGVRDLRIDSPVPLRVKNIKPLINGLFYTNHNTYTLVDDPSVGGSEPVIDTRGSTATTLLADFTKDKISFSFEVIEPVR